MTATVTLPPLREDLSLARGPSTDGFPTWTVYDPALHHFIRLGWVDFEILSRWNLQTPEAIVRSLRAETTIDATDAEIERLALFLRFTGFLRADRSDDTARMAQAGAARRTGAGRWLIHNYLFFRIRLVNPDRFLSVTLPAVRWMFSRAWLVILSLLALTGLWLISRQWDAYTHSLVEQFTLDGMLWMGIALSAAKVIHELGHGYAAKRYGCRVPSMGVALLVLWPVLWTDTTDAWRLDRGKRLVIDSAGMLAEIAVAAVASIAWAILPDGPARSAVFVLSSSTWILTLFINLSPLMRFDGYYILSDLMDFANLQQRGFSYACWWLREMLFRPRLPPPEQLPAATARILVVYSLASWTYRFFLFVSIALIVYHFAFKALGIVLMAIELWYFVSRPILQELAIWARIVARTPANRHTVATLAGFALLIVLFVIPWRGRVDAPGLLRTSQQATLFATEPGCLVWLAPSGVRHEAGATLARLESAEITQAVAVARARLEASQAELAVRSVDSTRRRTQQEAFARASAAAAALARANTRAAGLELRASFAGVVRDIPPSLRVGDCLGRTEPLGVLVDPTVGLVEAYIGEADFGRVEPGAAARFIRPELPDLILRISSLGQTSTRVLDVPELGSTHLGPIGVRTDKEGKLVPEQSIYRITLEIVGTPSAVMSRSTGVVVIEALPRSFAAILYRRSVALFRREASL